jgi:hypothetical protein
LLFDMQLEQSGLDDLQAPLTSSAVVIRRAALD